MHVFALCACPAVRIRTVERVEVVAHKADTEINRFSGDLEQWLPSRHLLRHSVSVISTTIV